MLSVKVTVEATFPDARLCCVIARLADISMYPSNTTISCCSSVFPLQVSAIYKSHTAFVSGKTSWPCTVHSLQVASWPPV